MLSKLLALGLLAVRFQGGDLGVGEAEVVGDLVDQDVADEAEQVFPGLDPLQQDGFAVEDDQVGGLAGAGGLGLAEGDAAVEAGQLPGVVQAQFGQGVVVGDFLDQDGDAADVLAEGGGDGNEGAVGFS